MTIQEAIRKRKLKKRKAEQLTDICMKNPDYYVQNGVIVIPDCDPPIYLPDKRFKGAMCHYENILNAIRQQQKLIPNSIEIDQAALLSYFDELARAKLIQRKNVNTATDTTDYILTLNAETWMERKANARKKYLIKILDALKPEAHIHLPVQ